MFIRNDRKSYGEGRWKVSGNTMCFTVRWHFVEKKDSGTDKHCFIWYDKDGKMMASYRDPKGKTYPPTDSSLKLLHRETVSRRPTRRSGRTRKPAQVHSLRPSDVSGIASFREPAEQRRPVEPVTVGLKVFLRVVTPIARSSARSASRE